MVRKFRNLFQSDLNALTVCDIFEHEIKTHSEKPIKQSNARIPLHMENEKDEEM